LILKERTVADQPNEKTDELIQLATTLTHEIAEVIAKLELDSKNQSLIARYEELHGILRKVHQDLDSQSEQLKSKIQAEFGVDDEFLRAIESLNRPELEGNYWNSDIQKVPTNVRLEDVVACGYERLMETVDSNWLREQAKCRYRQQYDDRPNSHYQLHIVGRQRLLAESSPASPQRFAQMLLLCEDFLSGRDDLDFFDAPMLVCEAAALGNSLSEISELGLEAKRKLQSLPSETSRDVASTVFELLVGAACVRNGLAAEMLEASNNKKTPDFRVHGLVVPMVLECKRRLGLNRYSEREARQVEKLYSAANELFERFHPLVEITFTEEVFGVSPESFVQSIARLCESYDDDTEESTNWGRIRLRRLPSIQGCSQTRVYSPVFLQEVFDWNHVESEWDGLYCQIEPTNSPVINKVSWPRGMKWRCDADRSLLKKARGLTSLWAEAVQQIPAGERGCVYIAYTEGMRGAIADARTQHLIDTVQERELFHKATVGVPLTVVDRLYPQSLGNGGIELIESAIPLTLDGFDFMLDDWPLQIFGVLPNS